MTGLIARLDTATAGYYEYLLHSYPEGKNFTQKAHSFSSPLLYTICLDTDLKERSPTAALEHCLCGALSAKMAVTDTSQSDSG